MARAPAESGGDMRDDDGGVVAAREQPFIAAPAPASPPLTAPDHPPFAGPATRGRCGEGPPIAPPQPVRSVWRAPPVQAVSLGDLMEDRTAAMAGEVRDAGPRRAPAGTLPAQDAGAEAESIAAAIFNASVRVDIGSGGVPLSNHTGPGEGSWRSALGYEPPQDGSPVVERPGLDMSLSRAPVRILSRTATAKSAAPAAARTSQTAPHAGREAPFAGTDGRGAAREGLLAAGPAPLVVTASPAQQSLAGKPSPAPPSTRRGSPSSGHARTSPPPQRALEGLALDATSMDALADRAAAPPAASCTPATHTTSVTTAPAAGEERGRSYEEARARIFGYDLPAGNAPRPSQDARGGARYQHHHQRRGGWRQGHGPDGTGSKAGPSRGRGRGGGRGAGGGRRP